MQKQLAGLVDRKSHLRRVGHVAGVDVGFEDRGATTRAAVALLTFPDLVLAEHQIARLPTQFPYIPGLLSFRELPAVMLAMDKLTLPPDLVLVDGQGLAHPRRFGIACHLGVLRGLPCVGVGKTRLLGSAREDPVAKGLWEPLRDHGEIVGALLRTRTGVKPVYVSIGHQVDLETAVDYVMACCAGYRLPEPIRWAHRLASGLIKPSRKKPV